MALSGDIKENYVQLQQSTGESFASMADRLEADSVLLNLDARGQAGNRELAAWLRKQSDDQDAIDRVRLGEAEYNRRKAGAKSAPQGRSATGGKSDA